MNKSYADVLIEMYGNGESKRQVFDTYWQSLHYYFYIEAQDITSKTTDGSSLNANYIYDATSLMLLMY